MKNAFLVFAFVFSLLLASCQKQTAPTLEVQEAGRVQDMERLKACTDVNFTHGVLLYQNTLLLFKCTKWDQEYPHMFKAMKEMKRDSWDQLIAPVNEAFLENKERKNKFFKSIHELDAKGGLDDLSYVIAALNESNFFDAIKGMFLCMDDSTAPECNDRLDRIPSRPSIKKILHILDIPPEVVEQNLAVIKDLSNSIGPMQEPLRNEINKFNSSPLMTKLKIQLIDELFKKINVGLTSADRELLSNIMLTPAGEKGTPWIYEWLHDEKLGREKFKDLVEYPALTNPEFLAEVRGLKEAYNANFNCSIFKDGNTNDLIQFDFKNHLADYVTVVKEQGYKSLFDFISSDIAGLKLSTPICQELERNSYNVNFIKLHADISDFLKEKSNYDLFKFLVTKTDTPFDVNNGFAQNLYLFDLVAGNIFSSTNNLNKEILKATREFYPVVFDVMENLSTATYDNAGNIAHEVFKNKYDPIFKGVSDYWLFLRPEEKNFVLNFIDRHFDKDIKYVLLFNFYAKSLEDYREVRPVFQKAWIENEKQEELTTEAIEDFVKHMSGKDALGDFKKFFSRNQIIKVLEVLSSGQTIGDLAKEELSYRDSTQYVLQSKIEKYKITIPYDPTTEEAYDAGSVVVCMKKFSDMTNGLYDLIRSFPSACQSVAADNIAFRMFGWMNTVEENYLQFKVPEDRSSSLLDKEGLFSPYMLNSQVGLLKIIDSVVAPYKYTAKGKGLEYLLRSANYHMNTVGAAPLLEKNIIMINHWADLQPENNILYRNSLIKSFSRATNFASAKDVVYRTGKTLEEYGQWIKSGAWKKASERSLGTHDSKYDCSKVINQHVSPNPCPAAAEIKTIGKDLLFLLSNVWEKSEESPIAQLMLAEQAEGGLDIPLDNRKTKKYRLSLGESLRYFYETSDRSLPINNIGVKYINEQGKEFTESVTTLERIETVIREVRFGNNYLGVSYLNHVVGGDDYNKDVKGRKTVLAACVKIPGVRCGKKMSDSDIRMTHNALASYDGLLDANNGRGLDGHLQFGDYLKTFQQTLVGSSAKESQAITFFPLNDDKLARHNGKVLGDLTLLTAFSNAARVVRDRIGRTREDFTAFINRADFKRVDRTLMHGFVMKDAGPSAEKLIKKIKDQNIFDEAVDWMSSLDYNQTRLVEDTAARLMVVGSYLGTPELVFEKSGHASFDERYKNNNIAQLFMALEKIVDYWPNIKRYFPDDLKLIDAVKPINTGLYFLTEKLTSTDDPEKNTTYQLLNDLALVTQTIIFDDLADPRILGNENKTHSGLEIALSLLGTPESLDYTIKTIRENYHYLDVFHQENSEWFLSAGQNLQRLAIDPSVDLTPLRDYLSFTSKNAVCVVNEKFCEKNYHYDEIANMSKFLSQKNETGETNFMLANKKLLLENVDQVIKMIKDVFPAIKIKERRPLQVL